MAFDLDKILDGAYKQVCCEAICSVVMYEVIIMYISFGALIMFFSFSNS